MKELMKPIFELLTGEYVILNNDIYNYIIMTIIGIVAFRVAWKTVGKLYREQIISTKSTGSLLHWIIRLIVFIVIFYVFSTIIWITKFIVEWKVYFFLVSSIFIALIIMIKIIKKYKRDKI